LCRQLAAELGTQGIRHRMVAIAWLPPTPLRRPRGRRHATPATPSYDQVANAAVYAASDWAATMTATEINLTGGAVVD
jgi:3-oxoacyl-[acyl-carrier protein] reductase